MQNLPFKPKNELEKKLVDAMYERPLMREFLKALTISDLCLPSSTEPHPDGTGLRPLIFDRENVSFIAAFTDVERVDAFSETAPYCLAINGEELLRQFPDGFGIVINPGWQVGVEIPADGVSKLRRDLASNKF